MVDWLYTLPAFAVLALAAALGLACILATGLVARLMPENAARSTAALDAYKIIVTFTAILLSFSLVQANGLLRQSEVAISVEAGAMNQLDRVLLRSHTPATDAARPLLHAYMRTVLSEDWPAMATGVPDSAARQSLAALNRSIVLMADQVGTRQQLYAEMLKQLDTINDARQTRMDSIGDGLPLILWQSIGLLCIVLVVLSAAIRMPARLVALCGHAIAIGVLTALTFVVDQPHRGSISVSADPIQRTLAQALARKD